MLNNVDIVELKFDYTNAILSVFKNVSVNRRPAVRKLWPAGQIWLTACFQLARVTLPAI